MAAEEPRPPVRAGAPAPPLGALPTKDPEQRATAEEALAALEAAAGGAPGRRAVRPGRQRPGRAGAAARPRGAGAGRHGGRTGPGPAARGRLVRLAGCFALILLTGTPPWNRLADLPHGLGPAGPAVIALVALGQALPRPRLHPAVVLPAVFAADVLLFHGLRPALGRRQTGFGTLPSQIGVNMLVISVGAWLLGWKVPGSRRS
ncbi:MULTISPECIES: hypothetical protein [Streptomyces]|uniref:hypothetical protein n=1 Tax=Streptomyces TaxID=1883 RepID=UPI001E365823|nr:MULTISPECIES: hypothetical protein [Streptomyces]